MCAVAAAVLALFTVSVTGLALVIVMRPGERGGDEDSTEGDDAWLAELRDLNAAMPYVHKHRAREAARAKGKPHDTRLPDPRIRVR